MEPGPAPTHNKHQQLHSSREYGEVLMHRGAGRQGGEGRGEGIIASLSFNIWNIDYQLQTLTADNEAGCCCSAACTTRTSCRIVIYKLWIDSGVLGHN